MHHLLVGLLNHPDPLALLVVALLATAGSAVMGLCGERLHAARGSWANVCAFGLATVATSWLAFSFALKGKFPQLAVAVPLAWMVPALLLSFATAAAAALIQSFGARTARNAMLAGSVLATGFSGMLFTAMSGLVRPFALSYDLSAVLITMLIGAALWSFSLWEASGLGERRGRILATALVSIAITVLAVGSLAAILPLEDWLTATARPDDLSTAPLLILLAAEAVAVLILALFGSLVDNRVAARDRLEADRMRQLADSTFEGIVIHSGGEILDGNERLAALLGTDLATLRANPLSRFFDPETIARSADARKDLAIETLIKPAEGAAFPAEILSRAISFGNAPAVVTALRDVREKKASEERIRFMAHHDMLTELPNRVALGDHLEASLRVAHRTGAQVGVLCLDLDGFKLVNDTLGHAAGDQLLCQVAGRLRSVCDDLDFIARIGGDEFVVVHRSGSTNVSVVQIATRLVESLTATFELDSQIVSVGTSIGIAQFPDHGATPEDLLKKADIALYKAKDDGRGWYCFFEAGMDQVLDEQRALEQDLRLALDRGELELQYQPLFDVNRQIIAFEALLRWNHPARGTIPPADFIPLAERSGLIVELGRWVLETACAAAAAWPRHCRIAVNLSPAQFLRGNLLSVVETALRKSGLAPSRLELEITEGVLLDNTDKSLQTLHALRNLGVRLALDDFGTGYASLSYLHRFPLDKLKVDQSFVQRIETEDSAHAIVKAILSMSRDLKLAVTAEGIETEGQFDILSAQGCEELQGYLLSRPLTLSEATDLMAEADQQAGDLSPRDIRLKEVAERMRSGTAFASTDGPSPLSAAAR